MRGMSPSLSAQCIAAYLTQAGMQPDAQSRTPATRPVTIEVVAETGSTNADLLAQLPHLSGPQVLIAERQTAGRGRAGKAWHSEPGAVLTFSLAWRFSWPLHALSGLPLAVGVALAETLAAESDAPIRLKWPNDVLKDGRKLAGVLIETARGLTSGESWAVIGIGINLKLPEQLAATIGQPAASLDLPDLDRNKLLAKIISALEAVLAQFEREGFAAFAARWNQWHAHAGDMVRIQEGEQVLHEGRAIGVADNGMLLLETASGMMSIMSGDVSLRAVEGRKEGEDAVTG